MGEEDVREIIKSAVARAPSLRSLAAEWGVSASYLSDCCTRRRAPGPAILKHLGIKQVVSVTYEYGEARGNGR